jgi:diaminopimelate epimerase
MATVRDPSWPLYVRNLCRRHFSIGANGVLVLMDPCELLIFNEDGSQAETCLNGLRCAADYLLSGPPVQIQMGGRLCTCSLADGMIVSEVGRVECCGRETLSIGSETLLGYRVAVGNPHFIIMKETTERWLSQHGTSIESHELFPRKTNVEFVWPTAEPFSYQVLVFERGCGLTLACGSGAAAITGLFASLGLIGIGQKLSLQMPGGQIVSWIGPAGDVLLSARAHQVFRGYLG